ncbi:hypothetical protein CEXT_539891 [Caerostris extrusa]|uniref:Uncharacterized protein n=1 Tax=Caerostris extrusa TaxID=172846 RepID=A0AAV4WEW7_CAEEX|nr:hypothetical protein CEXT_539891 [Caerostris extrusa]
MWADICTLPNANSSSSMLTKCLDSLKKCFLFSCASIRDFKLSLPHELSKRVKHWWGTYLVSKDMHQAFTGATTDFQWLQLCKGNMRVIIVMVKMTDIHIIIGLKWLLAEF